MPRPNTITKAFHEESPDVFVRDIVVKPVPFVTVAVRQEFEVFGAIAQTCGIPLEYGWVRITFDDDERRP